MNAQPLPNPEVHPQPQAPPSPVEPYLKLSHGLLARRDLGEGEKLLLAYVWGFGTAGCWAGNAFLADLFGTGPKQISRRIAALKDSGDLLWAHHRSHSRILWASHHPDVLAADSLVGRNTGLPQLRTSLENTRDKHVQKFKRERRHLDRNVQVSRTETSKSLGQKCPHIIKEKEKGNERQGTEDKATAKQVTKFARKKQVLFSSGGVGGKEQEQEQASCKAKSKSKSKQSKDRDRDRDRDRGQVTATARQPANLTESDQGAAPGSLRTQGDVRDQQTEPRPPGSFFHPRNPYIEKEIRDGLPAIADRLTQNQTPIIHNSLDSSSGNSPRRSGRSGPSAPSGSADTPIPERIC